MKNQKISIVGVPCDYGQQRRGVDMGQVQSDMQDYSNV